MVQIKHFRAPQKLPNFQFSRRANWQSRDKILGAPTARPENYCESKQTYFSYSVDKAFHLPEFLVYFSSRFLRHYSSCGIVPNFSSPRLFTHLDIHLKHT